VDETLGKRPLDGQNDILRYRVFTSTWNVGGMTPSSDLDLEDWMDSTANSYDIYVLGYLAHFNLLTHPLFFVEGAN
jgi:hypothetical protein